MHRQAFHHSAAAPIIELMRPLLKHFALYLALMGGLAARAGGARVMMGAMRVTFWGGLAMTMTAGIGCVVGAIAQ